MSTQQTRAVDAIGKIETHGIDHIPDTDRYSTPRNLFYVWFGAQMCFGIIVLGWLPVAFGLGWWSAVSSITVGLLVGCLPFAPFSLLGPRSGTNSAVTSGAHFGLIGRLVGSLQALFIAMGFAALTIWTGGDAIVAGGHRLISTPDGDLARAVAYGVISVIVITLAVYGHANVLAAQKIVIPTVGLLLLVGFFAKLGDFNASYSGGAYLLGDFWPTWVLAVVTAASLPISYTPFANDYARYVSPSKWSDRSIALWAGVGMFVGCWVTLVWAAYMSTMFKDPSMLFMDGVVASSPSWYVVCIVLIGFVGSLAQGALCLYGTGLDTSSLIPRLPRVPATLLISACAVLLVYLGALVWNAFDTVSAFLLGLIVICTPWMMICLIGFYYARKRYHTADLQLFNLGQTGGAYWYTKGINLRAAVAFVPAVFVGLMFLNTTLWVGPWANAYKGIDFSFTSAALISSAIYGLSLVLFPERNHPGREAEQTVAGARDMGPATADAPVVGTGETI
jgi:purine-cytosine permease-like protein